MHPENDLVFMIVWKIRLQDQNDIYETIRKVVYDFMWKWDLRWLYDLFNKVYDSIYQDLIFGKLFLSKENREIIEVLATPMYKKCKDKFSNKLFDLLTIGDKLFIFS